MKSLGDITTTQYRGSLKRTAGFTLIELIVTVVIVGILAAIAIPSYREYLIRSNRSGAQQHMHAISNMQEQFRLDNRSYASSLADLDITTPDDLIGKYNFSISGGGAGYQIVADSINAQASDGDLTLDNTGAKTGKW